MSDRIRNLSSYCAAGSPTSGNILNKPSHPTSFQNTYICDCWEEMFEPKRCLASLSPDLHPAAPSFVSSSRPQLHIIPTLTFACSESPLLDHKCGLSTYQRRYYESVWKSEKFTWSKSRESLLGCLEFAPRGGGRSVDGGQLIPRSWTIWNQLLSLRLLNQLLLLWSWNQLLLIFRSFKYIALHLKSIAPALLKFQSWCSSSEYFNIGSHLETISCLRAVHLCKRKYCKLKRKQLVF